MYAVSFENLKKTGDLNKPPPPLAGRMLIGAGQNRRTSDHRSTIAFYYLMPNYYSALKAAVFFEKSLNPERGAASHIIPQHIGEADGFIGSNLLKYQCTLCLMLHFVFQISPCREVLEFLLRCHGAGSWLSGRLRKNS